MKNKILIADDDTRFANSLAQDLKKEGFDMRTVENGAEAIKEMEVWKPNILLLDLFMSVKDGWVTLEEKKINKAISGIPVIVISESDDPKNIETALGLGVRDYVVKMNLNRRELVDKIKLQLGTSIDDANFDTKASLPSSGSLKGYKVVWVEDDAYLSDIISRKLSGEGCTLIHAKTGEEAVAFIQKDVPDVIMLDILLPGMDGFEVLEKIKKDEKLKNVPVILTSNLGQKGDIEKGQRLGAEKFLVKATVTLDEIISEMKKVLVSPT